MTSHNRCTTQRRLILPLSASGGLRQGRFPALRSGAICCIELCDVMPSPEAGGQVPRQAAKYAAPRFGHESPRPPHRVGLLSVPPCKPPPCQRSPEYMPLHVPVRWLRKQPNPCGIKQPPARAWTLTWKSSANMCFPLAFAHPPKAWMRARHRSAAHTCLRPKAYQRAPASTARGSSGPPRGTSRGKGRSPRQRPEGPPGGSCQSPQGTCSRHPRRRPCPGPPRKVRSSA